MSGMTRTQVERHLFDAADILRGRMDAAEYRDFLFGVLLLKRASDQFEFECAKNAAGSATSSFSESASWQRLQDRELHQGCGLNVPESARWRHIVEHAGTDPGNVLNAALSALKRDNSTQLEGVLDFIDFTKVGDRVTLSKLIDHFNRHRLSDENLGLSDGIGHVFDRLIDMFAGLTEKKSGNFCTPRSVIRLMVRLVEPKQGQSIYDPFAGSGGMLILAREYAEEHGQGRDDLAVYGQEINATAWSTAKLNLLLNGITDGSLLRGDTLTDPLHKTEFGELQRFDRILTNPPFSGNYAAKDIGHPERMVYGWAPERSKVDLMSIQHVLAVLNPDGIAANVTPHGILFRGGAESEIRRGITEDNRLEAVIGIGPNVFYGTSIPACILVLRGTNGVPSERRGSVLFVNAEREVTTGRTQNFLEPQHVEKIVSSFQAWKTIPGFARVVPLAEIAANGYNLNIRRYVDSVPPPEPPLDVRAALFGGVPREEIDAKVDDFRAFGIEPAELFRARDTDYFNFLPEGYEATAARIPELAAARQREFIHSYLDWWNEHGACLGELTGKKRLASVRRALMNSLLQELLPSGILNQYKLAGAFAAWWSDRQDDFRILAEMGFHGVVDRWTADGDRYYQRLAGAEDLSDARVREAVVGALGDDLCSRVEKLVVAERQLMVDTFRSWGDKYAITLVDLEAQRDISATRLKERLRELGYA